MSWLKANSFFIFDKIGNIAVKCFAYFVKQEAIISNDFVFVIIIYYLKFDTCSFGKLVSRNVALIQIFCQC